MHFKAWWKMCTDCKCTLDFWSIMPVVIAYINTNKPPTQSSDFYFISINVSWNTFVCIRKPPDPLKLQQACTVNYVEDWMLQSWIRKLCVTLGILLRKSNFLLLLSLAKKREKKKKVHGMEYTRLHLPNCAEKNQTGFLLECLHFCSTPILHKTPG